ncbi:MAG: hypothetical protein ACXWMS_05350 [Syntrophales bacterium]
MFLFWSLLAFVGAIAISFLKERSIVDFGSFESQKGGAMEKK